MNHLNDPIYLYGRQDREFDSFRLLRDIPREELAARCQRALDEGVPIDAEKEYGLEPYEEGRLY